MTAKSESAGSAGPPAAGAVPGTAPGLARRLGLFDATMLVMGGIIGSGIFINPYVVARQVHTPFLILGAWLVGGAVAMAGAFVYAELASLRPHVGGQYAFIREAFHPAAAFLYGWCLLLVTQSGGMAAVAITFARYFVEQARLPVSEAVVATVALAVLTAINCFGVKAGSNVQSAFMVMKTVAIAALVFCGLFVAAASGAPPSPLLDRPLSLDLVTAFGAALVPVFFAYGGWQTSGFVAGELKRPERDMPRGLVLGVSGVVVLYLTVNLVCVRVLGPDGLAASLTPASDVMRRALGGPGATLIAFGIAISTVGFLSQGILTAPRVYYAMARDGVFPAAVGRLDPRTRVPVIAILLQGIVAIVVALSGRYEQILNYVVSVDFIAFGLTGAALFVFRSRGEAGAFRTPGHPFTTGFFVAACWLVVLNTVIRYPANSAVGFAILAIGVPVYLFWRRGQREAA
jgi:basic amino acid/polyamine antiporter, APA family